MKGRAIGSLNPEKLFKRIALNVVLFPQGKHEVHEQ